MATYDDGTAMTTSGGGGIIFLVFLFFLLAWGGGFGGFGGNATQAALTQADLTNGFNNQDIQRKLNSIGNGLADGFYAQNTTMLNGFGNVNTSVLNSGYQVQQAINNGTMTDLQGFNSVNANINNLASQEQINSAAVQRQIAESTCSINTNATANTQAILDRLCAMETQNLRDALAAKDRDVLKYEIMQGQTANTQTILNAQGRYIPYAGTNGCGCSYCNS